MAQKSATGLQRGFLLRSPTTKSPPDETPSKSEPAEEKEKLCLPQEDPRDLFRMCSMAEISFTRVTASMSRPLYPSKSKKCENQVLKKLADALCDPNKSLPATPVETPPAPAESEKKDPAAGDCPNSPPTPDPEEPKIEDPSLPDAIPSLEAEDSTERIEIKSMADLESCIERFKVECSVSSKKPPVEKKKKEKKKLSKKESKSEKKAEKPCKAEENSKKPRVENEKKKPSKKKSKSEENSEKPSRADENSKKPLVEEKKNPTKMESKSEKKAEQPSKVEENSKKPPVEEKKNSPKIESKSEEKAVQPSKADESSKKPLVEEKKNPTKMESKSEEKAVQPSKVVEKSSAMPTSIIPILPVVKQEPEETIPEEEAKNAVIFTCGICGKDIHPNQQYAEALTANTTMAGGASPSFEDNWNELTRQNSSSSDENTYCGASVETAAVGRPDWQPEKLRENYSSENGSRGDPSKKMKQYQRKIQSLQAQITAEIEQNEIIQEQMTSLQEQIFLAREEANRKEEQHRLELDNLQMRLSQQDGHFQNLQSHLQMNQQKQYIRDLLLSERRDVLLIQSSLSHINIILEALKPENSPRDRQMNRVYFADLKDEYLQCEQVHLNNINILETGSDKIVQNVPVPKLSQDMVSSVGRAEQEANQPLTAGMKKWMPVISREIENMAKKAGVSFPMRASIECHLAKELQDQNSSRQWDLKVAIDRIAFRLHIPKPASPCPLISERPVATATRASLPTGDESAPQCAICHEDLGSVNLHGCPLCKQQHHNACLREWLKKGNTCPQCRAPTIFEEDSDDSTVSKSCDF